MSLAPAAPRTGFKFMLTVRDGPDAGAAFQLLPPKVTIGRGTDNHVSLTDPRMSRHAAVVEFSLEKIVIRDVSNRQSMMVNGDFMNEASIKDGDVIRIGDTELSFFVEALQLRPHPTPLTLATPGHAHAGLPPQPPRNAAGGLSGKQKFYAALVVGGMALAWLINSETAKKNAPSGPKTVEEIEKEIKESEKRQEEVAKKRIFKSEAERTQYMEAQKHFTEGFRDYEKRQWTRAMRSFETAMAIDGKHELAYRYYKLAEKQRDEIVALLTLEGRRYREKSMYSRCSAQFEKVLDLITNKEDVKYKAAEQLKKECDQHLSDRF